MTAPAPPRASLPAALARAALAAGALVALTHLVFDLLGADFRVQPPGQPQSTVSLLQAALIGLVVTGIGGGVAALVARRTRAPVRTFLLLVVLGLVLFAVNPVLAADQARTVVALEVEHLAAAAGALLVLPALRR